MKAVKTILLVEDSESLRNVLQDKLFDEGYQVFGAGGGEEGLKMAIEKKPDLIITDLVMFPVDGKSMIESIRKDEWGKTAPIVALTNSNDTEEEDRLKPFGLLAYWSKADSGLDEVVQKIKDLATHMGGKKAS